MPVRNHRGFTLLEMTFVLFVLGVFLQLYFTIKADIFETAAIQKTILGFGLIDEAVVAYRTTTSNGNRWPTDLNQLIPYLPGFTNANGDGLPYEITPSGLSLVITTTLTTKAAQQRVAEAFPTNSTMSAAAPYTVSIGIPVPGTESSGGGDLFLRSAGPSQHLRGVLHMGGNAIESAQFVSMQELRFGALRVAGHSCSSSQYRALAISSGDKLLICNNARKWQAYNTNNRPSVVFSGIVDNNDQISPPSEYNMDECMLSVNLHNPTYAASGKTRAKLYGRPNDLWIYAERKSNYFVIKYQKALNENNPQGWEVKTATHRAGWGVPQARYQMVCAKNPSETVAPRIQKRL